MSLESLKFRRKEKIASERASQTENIKPSEPLLALSEASGSELPSCIYLVCASQ